MRLDNLFKFAIPNRKIVYLAIAALMVTQLAGCGGASEITVAQRSPITISQPREGVSPFISFIDLQGDTVGRVSDIRFSVLPKPGRASKPVMVTQSSNYLARRGYTAIGSSKITLPIFGLYAGFTNTVRLNIRFVDGSELAIDTSIQTSTYVDENNIYDQLKPIQPRNTSATLGFDYFYLKPTFGAPVVVDTDGEVRWVGAPKGKPAASVIFLDNAFVVGDNTSLEMRRLEMDGTFSSGSLKSSTYTDFHHNIDAGKDSLLGEFDANIDGQSNIESILAAFTESGSVIYEWDFGKILSDYMSSQGDDPTQFVRPGTDWFHMNASTYDSMDDSIIVSSRENFLVKIDYRTKNIIWIFGDPTKYWYRFPSLRAKALALTEGGLYPIGQHGISVTPDGKLLIFNNGYPSFRQPVGAPSGESRDYSAVSAYAIDKTAGVATEVWRFDYGRSLKSDICSSAYQAGDGSVLVNYSAVEGRTKNRIVGLDAAHNVVFDFELPTKLCETSFNSQIIPLEALVFR